MKMPLVITLVMTKGIFIYSNNSYYSSSKNLLFLSYILSVTVYHVLINRSYCFSNHPTQYWQKRTEAFLTNKYYNC